MVILGCAGWGPMQLDNELNDSAWLACPISKAIIFSTNTELRYEKAMMMI